MKAGVCAVDTETVGFYDGESKPVGGRDRHRRGRER